jgi:hypothetical protein
MSNINNSSEFFLQKQSYLLDAVAKVNSKLNYFKEESSQIVGQWTDAHREYFMSWNSLHDLIDRLEDRINDNLNAFGTWHYDNFGFSVININ